MRKALKLIYVEWADHHSFVYNEWHDLSAFEGQKPLLVKSVGFLVRENKDHLIIAAHHAKRSDKACGEMMILKSAIVWRKTLRVPKNGKR